MEEVWKDIYFTDFDGVEHDYRGKYQISNMGRLRGFADKHGKIYDEPISYFNPQPQTNGYICYHLRDGKGGSRYVKAHKLVAFMFIPIPQELLDTNKKIFINHKNEIKHDNRVNNLEWCTPSYNSSYGTASERKVTSRKSDYTTKRKSVLAINEKGEQIKFISMKEAMKYFRCTHDTLRKKIANKETVNGYKVCYI